MLCSLIYPEGDRKCERMNQTIIKSLRLICNDQTLWADKLAPVLMSHRASVATRGLAPTLLCMDDK